MTLAQLLSSGETVLMDAAMGSRLLALPVGCSSLANLSHPLHVQQIHHEHIQAGARVLLTNTFQANPPALARHGHEADLETILTRAVRLARQAAGPKTLVLGDVGPIFSPGSSREFADRDALRRTLACFHDVDGILFETCSSPDALSAVAFAFHRVSELADLPLLLSLTYLRDSRGKLVTWSGHAPELYARHAVRHGVAALGVNCGKEITFLELAEILRRYRQETDLPLFVRPNAGTPDACGVYPRFPPAFAAGASLLVEAGARLLGGCCGTTAAHLAAIWQGLIQSKLSDIPRGSG